MKRNWSKNLLALTMVGAMVFGAGCGAQEPVDSQKNEDNSAAVKQEITAVGDKTLVEGDISRVSVHDPSIFVEVDENNEVTYYLFGTHIKIGRAHV